MTRRFIHACSLMAAVALASTVLFAQGKMDDEVKALELSRFQAMEKNDFAALDRLLADDLVYTHSSGAVDSKTAYIDTLKSGKTRYVKIVPEDLKIRALGDTALIHGKAAMTLETSANGQKSENSFTVRFLDVWQKRNGKWQMIAWQSTRLPATPPSQ
jgi:ketosteroid isomerase-like protein